MPVRSVVGLISRSNGAYQQNFINLQ